MNSKVIYLSLIVCFAFCSGLHAQNDFFVSTQGLGEGPVNSSASSVLNVGESGSFHLYFDNRVQHPNVDTCVWFTLNTSQNGVVRITNFETFDYDIQIAGININRRWADSFGPGIIESNGQFARSQAFTVVGGQGMVDANTGSPFLDLGYDIDAEVFHVARIDYEAIGVGAVDFVLETDPTVFIGNNGMALQGITYGEATVEVAGDILIGDVNLDGMVTLLDVAPFIDRIQTGEFQLEADCNEDGVITLLDVDPFIDAIQFP